MNKHPKLRSHVRKGKGGRVRTYYFYDMRPEPDIPLGSDYALAVEQWTAIHLHKPRIKGALEEAFERWEKDVLPGYTNAGTQRTYRQSLKQLRGNGVGKATWEGVTFKDLKGYLKARSAKTQANREMALLSIIWNYARGEGLTDMPWPAAGMERSRWRNKEAAREFAVTDALFSALYKSADQMLRDAMDLATATGLRLTDCLRVQMPVGDSLRVTASKTGKAVEFSWTSSPVLFRVVETRRQVSASHLMLLTTSTGSPVTMQMLRGRWDKAREAAAKAHPELASQIKAMYLRDMRKRASDLAETLEEASKLLQHSSTRVTKMHYRTKADRVKPVR